MPWNVLYCILLGRTLGIQRSVQHLNDTGLSMAEDFTSQLQLVVFPSGKVRLWLREEEEWHEELSSLCSVLLKNWMRAVYPSPKMFTWLFLMKNCSFCWARGFLESKKWWWHLGPGMADLVPRELAATWLPRNCCSERCPQASLVLEPPITAPGRGLHWLFPDQR